MSEPAHMEFRRPDRPDHGCKAEEYFGRLGVFLFTLICHRLARVGRRVGMFRIPLIRNRRVGVENRTRLMRVGTRWAFAMPFFLPHDPASRTAPGAGGGFRSMESTPQVGWNGGLQRTWACRYVTSAGSSCRPKTDVQLGAPELGRTANSDDPAGGVVSVPGERTQEEWLQSLPYVGWTQTQPRTRIVTPPLSRRLPPSVAR